MCAKHQTPLCDFFEDFYHRVFRMILVFIIIILVHCIVKYCFTLQSQLGASPVTTLGVPFNSIVRAHTDPLRQGSVLSLLFGQSSLGAKGFLGRLHKK